ncbi:MAG: ABC transporter ATP-binding protein [Deltaproteobacteria bacterium]
MEIKNLSKSFGNTEILHNINLKVENEEAIVLFGPSGSGKTTLLRLIAGLEVPDEGTIVFGDKVVGSKNWALEPNKRGISVVFQSHALWPHMTVEKNILFGIDIKNKNLAKEKVENIIEETGLKGLEKRYPHQLSGGQAKRAAFARALVQDKAVYLMDEPLVNQDDEIKEELIGIVKRKLADTKAILVYVTHDMEEAKRISQRIVKIKGGKLM